jgi:hypothetical protein
MSLLRHWLIFHKMMDNYTALCFGRPYSDQYSNSVKDEPVPIKQENLDTSGEWEDGESNPRLPSDQPPHPKAQLRIQCLMCDDVRLVGATPLEFHKHLVEKHFRERMLALIPCTGTSPEGKPKYSCPFSGCYYEHHYKWIIAKHYGVKHRMAKQFYEEVTGLRKCETLPEVPPLQEVKPDDLKISPLLGPEALPPKPQRQVAFLSPLNQFQPTQFQESQPVVPQQFLQQTQELQLQQVQLQTPQLQTMHLPLQVHVLTPQTPQFPANQTFVASQIQNSGSNPFQHLQQQQSHLQVQQPTMQLKPQQLQQQQLQQLQQQQQKHLTLQVPCDPVPAAVVEELSNPIPLPPAVLDQPPAAASEPVQTKPSQLVEVEDDDLDEDDEDLDETIGLSTSESELVSTL